MKHWGFKLKELIKRSGLDQKAVAQGINESEANISNWTNKPYPDTDKIERICDYLKIPLWKFFAPDDVFIPDLTPNQLKFNKLFLDSPPELQEMIVQAIEHSIHVYKLGQQKKAQSSRTDV